MKAAIIDGIEKGYRKFRTSKDDESDTIQGIIEGFLGQRVSGKTIKEKVFAHPYFSDIKTKRAQKIKIEFV